MYKDFKKSESLDTGFVGGSGIVWMFSGIVIGLLVGLGMYYFSNAGTGVNAQQKTLDSEQNTIKKEQFNEPQPQSEAQPQKQQMDNISMLDKANKDAEESEGDGAKTGKRKNKFTYYAVLPNTDVPVGSAKAIDTSHVKVIKPSDAKKKVASRNNKAEQSSAVKKGKYLVRIASFRKKKMANHAVRMLKKRGIGASLQKTKIKGRIWYRITAGPVDKTSANLWKKKAEKLGHHPIISPLK